MGAKDWIISTRFIVTMGHLVSILLLFSTYEANVSIGLSDRATAQDKHEARSSTQAALIFASFCFGFDFVGMFLGTSLFYYTVNMFQIFVHFVGSVFLAWVITENFNYKAIWPIVAFTNIPPALVEIWILVAVYRLKIYKP